MFPLTRVPFWHRIFWSHSHIVSLVGAKATPPKVVLKKKKKRKRLLGGSNRPHGVLHPQGEANIHGGLHSWDITQVTVAAYQCGFLASGWLVTPDIAIYPYEAPKSHQGYYPLA